MHESGEVMELISSKKFQLFLVCVVLASLLKYIGQDELSLQITALGISGILGYAAADFGKEAKK